MLMTWCELEGIQLRAVQINVRLKIQCMIYDINRKYLSVREETPKSDFISVTSHSPLDRHTTQRFGSTAAW